MFKNFFKKKIDGYKQEYQGLIAETIKINKAKAEGKTNKEVWAENGLRRIDIVGSWMIIVGQAILLVAAIVYFTLEVVKIFNRYSQ